MTETTTSLFERSQFHMADISEKAPSFRRAIAIGRIHVGAVGFTHIRERTLPKGDVLKLAEIAGVQGAKLAWQQIPMCHPMLLDHVAILPELDEAANSVVVYATVATTARTGVEMEAMAAINAALLTIYDLTKPVNPALTITEARIVMKEGGKSGLWFHPDGVPPALAALLPQQDTRPLRGRTAAVITLSDRAYNGTYEDRSGPALKALLEKQGCQVVANTVLPDEADLLEQEIRMLSGSVQLIITTGGTGVAPRDVTPQVLLRLDGTEVPGFGEVLRSSSAAHVPTTWLSRSIAVIFERTLVIALPGSVGGVKDGMKALAPLLPHALDLIEDRKPAHADHHGPDQGPGHEDDQGYGPREDNE
nr:bifunctional molybdenum cofactor biosynthesis protein MoaC/MoaB [uncultured Cohaesibacter sp.]